VGNKFLYPYEVDEVLDRIGVVYEFDGTRYMVNCPFHPDENPSCGLWADSGYFKCFAGSCQREGTFAEFIAEHEGISIGNANRLLRGEDDISDLEEHLEVFLDEVEESKDEVQYFSYKSFQKTYPALAPRTLGWDYILGRNIQERMIYTFDMRWGREKGKFGGRVILPIRTVQGKLLAYVGRAASEGIQPKTKKNRSPHRTFFGLYELLKSANSDNLSAGIVVEGEFDAIYLQQFGIPAISNMGTNPMGTEKLRLLKKHFKTVILSYDNDDAGYRAMYLGPKGKKDAAGQVTVLQRYMPTISVDLEGVNDPNELTEDQIDYYYGEWRIPCLIS
jgi:DNA primase